MNRAESVKPSGGPLPRLFAAVPLSSEIKDELRQTCLQLRSSLPFHKWAHPEDLHLTLKFLGETAAELVEPVVASLQETAAAHRPFALSAGGLGVFGPPGKPAVLWSALGGDIAALSALQRDVETAMARIGFPTENRPYRPHLTLARRYKGTDHLTPERLSELEPHLPRDSLNWTVHSIVLYRSHLGRSPMYEPIRQFPLQTAST